MKTIGPFRSFALLGGGEMLLKLAQWAQSQVMGVTVITSPRHALEEVAGTTFENALRSSSIDYLVTAELTDEALFPRLRGATFALSFGAAWIFSQRLITEVFRENLYNVHSSRLPQHRGGGGWSWQIMTGNRFGFCNVHKLEAGIDTGRLLFTREFLFAPSCRTPQDFNGEYIRQSFGFLTELLAKLASDGMPAAETAQPEYLSTYWPRLNTDVNGWIDWSWDVAQLERFICAFDEPYAGAHTMRQGAKVFLKKVSVNLQDSATHPFQAGMVYRKTDRWICIAANGGALVVERVLGESGTDILSKISVGDRLYTPAESRDSALNRVSYTPSGLKA